MSLKKFIVQLLLYFILFAGIYFFFVYKLSKGYVDQFYNKVNQDAGSLIIGLSRADQGIDPFILEEELSNYDKPIVNFSMNAHQSAFGEVYLQGIDKKLSTNNINGLFIVSISPGNFTVRAEIKDDKIYDLDKEAIIGSIDNLTSKPNFDYIISKYQQPLYNSLFNKENLDYFMSHPNGWNEIALAKENDSKDMAFWKEQTTDYYNREIKKLRISKYRIKYFVKTIEYLKTKGKVFVIRMPSDLDVVKFENDNWKNFDSQFDSISKKHSIPYFNYSKRSNEFIAYDGSHLESESAKKFTKLLSIDIKNYLKTKKSIN
ncbi:hypothetical protein [Flavivirga algicola]|uniref:DUF1574 domain-containing protein n=1 Tax=Flavivirga algicola TaxID=2729136 RepID=A0ABX1RXC0_9FLAO|nr:hypothetical protein [Flavivirga algicola]NMH88226.1 hypothetical protein [Flavivirga algicola]